MNFISCISSIFVFTLMMKNKVKDVYLYFKYFIYFVFGNFDEYLIGSVIQC